MKINNAIIAPQTHQRNFTTFFLEEENGRLTVRQDDSRVTSPQTAKIVLQNVSLEEAYTYVYLTSRRGDVIHIETGDGEYSQELWSDFVIKNHANVMQYLALNK